MGALGEAGAGVGGADRLAVGLDALGLAAAQLGLVAVALLRQPVEGRHAQIDRLRASLQAAEVAFKPPEQPHGAVVGLAVLVAIVLAQAEREFLAQQRFLGAFGDPGAGRLDARQQATAAQGVVADHVFAAAELVVEQVQGVGRRIALALALLEARDELFHRVQLLDRALSVKTIARALNVSPGTIKWHLKNVYAKLGAVSREDAVAKARTLKILA